MAIRILPHSEQYREAVAAFNERMAAGGSPWSFYSDPVPTWIPHRPGQNVWREYYVALDAEQVVRGGYALKPQDWWVGGETLVVTDWQGPFSEGAVDPQYGTLGFLMMRNMLQLHPRLYSWGHGGDEQPLVELLRRMGWQMHPTPLCLLIARPLRFLRRNGHLRQRRRQRLLLDALAWTGLGSLGLRALHASLRFRSRAPTDGIASEVPEFSGWADQLWERCKSAYAAVAVRDRASMNALTPVDEWPPVHRLRVDRGGTLLGWALVMDTQMRGDRRFGTMRVGSIVDCFGLPGDASRIVGAATRHLVARGVDVVVSNQSHREWILGFAANGYVILPGKRLFAPSPALRAALEAVDPQLHGLHLTNMDGHGPHAL